MPENTSDTPEANTPAADAESESPDTEAPLVAAATLAASSEAEGSAAQSPPTPPTARERPEPEEGGEAPAGAEASAEAGADEEAGGSGETGEAAAQAEAEAEAGSADGPESEKTAAAPTDEAGEAAAAGETAAEAPTEASAEAAPEGAGEPDEPEAETPAAAAAASDEASTEPAPETPSTTETSAETAQEHEAEAAGSAEQLAAGAEGVAATSAGATEALAEATVEEPESAGEPAAAEAASETEAPEAPAEPAAAAEATPEAPTEAAETTEAETAAATEAAPEAPAETTEVETAAATGATPEAPAETAEAEPTSAGAATETAGETAPTETPAEPAAAEAAGEAPAAEAPGETGAAASTEAEPAEPKPPKPPPPDADPAVAALRTAKEEGTVLEGKVIGWNQGGFHVVINGVTVFCPRSEMEIRNPRSPNVYMDQDYRFRVIKHQKRGRRIVVSRKSVLEEEREALAAETLEKLEPGADLEGRVSSLTTFGAFVDLGGVEGLVHLTELSRRRVGHPKEVVSVGDEVTVRVLKIEEGGDRISLSMKALEPDPWADFAESHPRGSEFTGKIVRKTDFGLFVEVEPGMDGLVHLSRLPVGKSLDDEDYAVGTEVSGWVVSTEPKRERISLSLSEVPEDDPWESVTERFPEGTVVEGEVEDLAPFGAFVRIAPGLTGLLPKSEAGLGRGQELSNVYSPGRKVKLQISSVDPRRKRISLVPEGAAIAGSRADYKSYMKQQEGGGGGLNAMAAAFAKLERQREEGGAEE